MIYYCLYIVYIYIEYRDLWKGIESLPPAMEWEKHLYQNLPHTGCQLNPQKMVNGPLLGTIWGFPKIVVPQNGWFTEENPIGYHHLRKHPFGTQTGKSRYVQCLGYYILTYQFWKTLRHNRFSPWETNLQPWKRGEWRFQTSGFGGWKTT